MAKRTLHFDVELTAAQDADFALFTKTFNEWEVLRICQSNWGSDDAPFWGIMNDGRVIGLANSPLKKIVEDTRKAEEENGTELGEVTLKQIKPFLPQLLCIQKKNGGVFNCLLKSGLWLVIAPKIQLAADVKGD